MKSARRADPLLTAHPMPAADHHPHGHAMRYTADCYRGMRDDVTRTEAYRKAIAAAAPGKVVLDVGTGALALLAIFAAEAGARHVYALEGQPSAAAAARAAVASANLDHRITVLEAFSTDLALELPERAELLVHELIGEVAGEEGACAAILDAMRRHVADAARPPLSVPSRASTLLAPCLAPDPDLLAKAAGAGRALKLDARSQAGRPLAPPQVCEDLRFDEGSPSPSQRRELLFCCEAAGVLAALNLHVELRCGADAADGPPDVSSAWDGSHWRIICIRLERPASVARGQRVKVRVDAALAGQLPSYTFSAALVSDDGTLTSLGAPLEYPVGSLTVNDAMDQMSFSW